MQSRRRMLGWEARRGAEAMLSLRGLAFRRGVKSGGMNNCKPELQQQAVCPRLLISCRVTCSSVLRDFGGAGCLECGASTLCPPCPVWSQRDHTYAHTPPNLPLFTLLSLKIKVALVSSRNLVGHSSFLGDYQCAAEEKTTVRSPSNFLLVVSSRMEAYY